MTSAIQKLNEDICAIFRDTALSDDEKNAAIRAIVAAQREGAFTTGASIHYFTGRPGFSHDVLTALSGVEVAIAHRIHKGAPDGIGGSAGGLAKRIASTKLDNAISKDGVTPKYPEEVLLIDTFGKAMITGADVAAKIAAGEMTDDIKAALISVFDDVVEGADGNPAVTEDAAIILDKNIRREAREELGPRAYQLMRPTLDSRPFNIALTGITDDRYVLTPAWWADAFEKTGQLAYPCTATTTFMRVDDRTFHQLVAMTKTVEAGDGEITGLTSVTLPDLLSRLSGNGHGNPGHRPDYHYRHTHEGMVAWRIAAQALDHNADKMVALTKAIAPRYAADNPLDFAKIATQVKMTLADFDRQFGLPAGTFDRMQEAANAAMVKPAAPKSFSR